MYKSVPYGLICLLAVLSGLSACSRAPACDDAEVVREVTRQAKDQIQVRLTQRFQIPYLSPEATSSLVALFAPDSSVVSEPRVAASGTQDGWRQCEARIDHTYVLEGRVEKARPALEHGAVTGQTVAYMLEGEPYLSAIRRLAPQVSSVVSYRTTKAGDGKVQVAVEDRDLPVF